MHTRTHACTHARSILLPWNVVFGTLLSGTFGERMFIPTSKSTPELKTYKRVRFLKRERRKGKSLKRFVVCLEQPIYMRLRVDQGK